jgi:hypothetical protein
MNLSELESELWRDLEAVWRVRYILGLDKGYVANFPSHIATISCGENVAPPKEGGE